ncbi:protein-L-isoaspartate O-methyltransferase family protein [Methylocystis bryophila]|uniref:Protein-L-isoaspartate O-methyltransferase n=1 Tax=Methylocystis bryophila TaxID=655015 RepID=A0A1W6MQB0_9HYPH|nr:methyltransferase domain-containing protein [Methylocystis bryophila]ARN79726.1 protein-L-isoaspartate(D-aspartate) O-methyltransferase [Methylocystis bryophila]BDV39598.1 protein-L-isoaspartate O-methyltransferase [Methylocystis bryophila]
MSAELTAGAEVEQRAALLLQLRRAGVRNVAIMRAIERAPRLLFAPHRFRDLADRDMALPIDCGQSMPSAADLGRRIEALRVTPEHRVLEVGSGSGYAAAVLAQLAREVISLERYASLAAEASARLASAGVMNARVIHADGLEPPAELGAFERIILHVATRDTPAGLVERLALGGVLVFARVGQGQTRSIRLERTGEGVRETDLGPCRLPLAAAGLAARL